jgi:DNA polymerase-3 subunit delta'
MSFPWLEAVDAEFSERYEQGRLPHALLLCGPRDTGKVALASRFIASLLCRENQHPACGACRSCQLLISGAHPDRHTITFEENPKTGEFRTELVISQVRSLISSLYLTNTISRRKAALIYPVESMNKNTANALLKTLEEPPGDTVLVLVSHDPARLPATIRSRCQNLQVRLPGLSGAAEWLCGAGGTSRTEAEAALMAAAGSPLGALRMLQDGSTDKYRLVMSTLKELRMGINSPGAAMAALADVDPDMLWSWISLLTASELKGVFANPASAKALSELQSSADKNRKLLPTPVRKDFLLQDWLIQWSRLGLGAGSSTS